MASPAPVEQSSRVRGGHKRKRETDDHDTRTEERQFADTAENEADSMNPDDDDHETDNENDNDNGSTYTPDDEDEELQEADDDDDAGYESFSEENANITIYDGSQEPFPAYVVYDSRIADIKKRLTLIPKEVLRILPEDSVKSKSLSMHIAKAKEITEFPKTAGIKIAILGSAGAGKSSLLNAVTNIPELAKSMSGGQSCTSVPMLYCGATTRQPKALAAGLQYLEPDGIRRQIRETIRDYSTYAFDMDPEWEENEKLTARTVHANAEAMLRTMFSNLPGFKTKVVMKKTLQQHHSLSQREPSESSLLDELLQVCEEKLKETSKHGYIKQFSADTPTELKALIDPYLTTPSKFSKPIFWPLIQQVRIGVRGSRVLDSVTLIDLPGISDTNEARVELTHEFIKSCDYIWVVAPLERIADDSTVNQLFSRYARPFKGNICVICTHTDDGVIGDEDNLIDLVGENLEGNENLLVACSEIKEEISRKTTEINRLARQSMATPKSRASKGRAAATQQTSQVSLADLQRQRRVLRSKFSARVVLARNALITQQLIENLGRHMPEGSELDVHCVSSLHYAVLKGRVLHGPRLSAEDTGIPGLRAQVLALSAPRLQETLEYYMSYSIPLNLKSSQAWLNGTAVDCRSELLNLVRQPQEDLEFFVGHRLAAFQRESTDRMQKVLEASIPEAKEAASRHVAKKRNKFGATIMAFVRKNGKHSTRVCPKECWNEGFLRYFAEVVKECQHSLSEARQDLNEECKQTAIQRLDSLISSVEAHPASFPKGMIMSQMETCKFGIDNTFTESERNYAKGTRNLVIDATQDREKNIFSSSMQSIYQECNNEFDRKRISSRSLDRLEAHLTQDGPKNPFAVASRNLTRGILQVDKTDILEHVQTSISEIFNRLYISMDELLDDTQVDDTEAEARRQMKEVLPAQHAGLKAICQDYTALKSKYEDSR